MNTTATARATRTLAYYWAFISLGLITGVFGPTLKALGARTQTSLGQISIIFAVRSMGYLIGSFLVGRRFDRLDGHRVLACALALTGLCFLLIPVIPILWLTVAVVALLGIAEGAIDVGCNTLLLSMYRGRSGPYINGLHFCFGAGAFLSPSIVAFALFATGRVEWAFWMLALITLPIAVVLAGLPTVRLTGSVERDSIRAEDRSFVLLSSLFLSLYVGAELVYGNWIFSYATTLSLSHESEAALLTSGFWGAFTLGRLLNIPLVVRFRPARLLVVDLVGSIVCVASVLCFGESRLILWVGTVGTGLFLAPMFPMILALAQQRMDVSGRVTSWFLVGAGLGAMSMPWLAGQFFEPFGAVAMPILVLCCLALSAVLLALLLRRSPCAPGGET